MGCSVKRFFSGDQHQLVSLEMTITAVSIKGLSAPFLPKPCSTLGIRKLTKVPELSSVCWGKSQSPAELQVGATISVVVSEGQTHADTALLAFDQTYFQGLAALCPLYLVLQRC